ncbi:MAG: helix-hairpin-helix domain-containing protein [Candidatus Omnitrophica bacterium]|nr:helix-hairpin-helix domain-containing protein [Candidatus Omnitrophota bacterium]
MGPLTGQERRVLLFVSLLLALGIGLSFFKKTIRCNICLVDIHSKKQHSVVDINTATRDELLKLPGIGPKTADDIIAARVNRGGFKSVDDLNEINGISDSKLGLLRRYITIGK